MRTPHLAAIGFAALAACAASAQKPSPSGSVATTQTAATATATVAPTATATSTGAGEAPATTSSSGATSPSATAASASPSSGADPDAPAAVPVATPAAPPSASACNEQSPQDFLVRGNFLKTPHGNERAIQYRTDTYGYFPGFGRAKADAHPPSYYVVGTTFMGLPVRMHRKVVPALKCVEEEIKQSCGGHPYTAHALAGIRFKNTYRGGEVTNHIYGIAIDVDPSINTCCGCVKPWSDAPRCKKAAKSEYDRMEMPECWVHAFERYGFYWLGHDALQDTMHFEFLGDPDHILKGDATASSGKTGGS